MINQLEKQMPLVCIMTLIFPYAKMTGILKNKAGRKMVKALDNVPYNERQWGHWLATNLINTKQKLGLGVSKKLEKSSSEENWQQQLADELHEPIKRTFIRRRVIANGIDKIWCSDLVERQQFSKWNKGYRYLLMVLDLFSKNGWIIPMKDKKRRDCHRSIQNHL